MSNSSSRREFLKSGTVTAAGFVAASSAATAAQTDLSGSVAPGANAVGQPDKVQQNLPPANAEAQSEYSGFSRYRPTRGNDPDSPYYLGKMVPGFRRPDQPRVPFHAPDLESLPWEMKGGAKEFHLRCTPVSREFLPGTWINVYGFNDSMPGPTIEVNQGDRIRIVVHNELPEATTVHWHGFELPVQFDGASTLTQEPIEPGKSYIYEFDVHEEGTFFYHSHNAMQETAGMVGWMVVHPREAFDPPVDRDFGLIFQNFRVDPMQTVVDSWGMDFNWHTINGRSGPYTTPLVCRHGERVRLRIMNFSPIQHHPIHLHGHTFWVTGHEGARIPRSAWIPRNTELIGIAQASTLEFIANNPGDWMLHCHMTHHMMNHMVRHVGPRLRQETSVQPYQQNLEVRPRAQYSEVAFGDVPPAYPQRMQGMTMSDETMQKVWSRREVKGMRKSYPRAVKGLMTVLRVLPDDLYHRVMESDEDIPKGAVYQEIVRRFGGPDANRQ